MESNKDRKFLGYLRPDGSVGIRNHVAIISTVWCANGVTTNIAANVFNAVPIVHHQGCPGVPIDLERTKKTLVGLGNNPNVAAVLLVGLGCESVDREEAKEELSKSGKPVEYMSVQESGGSVKAIATGIEIAAGLSQLASEQNRIVCDISKLVIATKCGSSDATSGPSSNRVVGYVADLIIRFGGSFILGEICDLLGTEDYLAKRAVNSEVSERIYSTVDEYIESGKRFGFDIVGSNLTYGNKMGGITTLTEKSLGAVAKGGTARIVDVLEYGDSIFNPGLYIIKGPARSLELLSGQAAAGAQLNLWTTGRGTPGGHPLMPVIKVTGNSHTWKKQNINMDFDVSGIIRGSHSVEEYGKALFEEVIKVASGKLTKSEILKCDRLMDIEGYSHII